MIGPAITAALPELRAQARSLMMARVSISRSGGAPVWDPETESMSEPTTPVYDGPGRLLPPNPRTAGVDAAGEAVMVTDRVVAVPWDVTGIEDGDRLTVDGVDLVVESASTSTHAVELRLRCREQH